MAIRGYDSGLNNELRKPCISRQRDRDLILIRNHVDHPFPDKVGCTIFVQTNHIQAGVRTRRVAS